MWTSSSPFYVTPTPHLVMPSHVKWNPPSPHLLHDVIYGQPLN